MIATLASFGLILNVRMRRSSGLAPARKFVNAEGDDRSPTATRPWWPVLEDDLVAEIFVERERRRSVVGNVYKGRVRKSYPACNPPSSTSARARLLPLVDDVIDTMDEFDKLAGDDEDEPRGESGKAEPKGDAGGSTATAIATGRSRRSKNCCAGPKSSSRSKEPLGTKGARLTSHVTMPGRFSSSCRPSITSACRARSSRGTGGAGCARSCASSARRTASPAA